MQGFGNGPFGLEAFGRLEWARTIFWDSLPEDVRQQDTEGYLEAYSNAVSATFDALRDAAEGFRLLPDPDKVPAKEDTTVRLLLGKVIPILGDRLQGGVNGTISAIGEFSAPHFRPTALDIGRSLVLRIANAAPVSVEITALVAAGTVLIEPVIAEASGIKWEVYGRPVDDGTITVEVLNSDGIDLLRPGWVVTDGDAELEVSKRRLFPKLEKGARLLRAEIQDGRLLDLPAPFGVTTSDGRIRALVSSFADFSTEDIGCIVTLPEAQAEGTASKKWRVAAVASKEDTAAAIADWEYANMGSVEWEFGGLYEDWEYANLFSSTTGATMAYLVPLREALDAEVVETPPVEANTVFAALWSRPVITLKGNYAPQLIVEQGGHDLTSSDGVNVISESARFSDIDVGKLLTVYRPGNADAGYVSAHIASVSGPGLAVLDKNLGAAAALDTPLRWELRGLPEAGFGPVGAAFPEWVEAHPPDILPFLAANYGLSVEKAEPGLSRRRWVRSAPAWTGGKGNAEAYDIIGRANGVSLETAQLFRISNAMARGVPASKIHPVFVRTVNQPGPVPVNAVTGRPIISGLTGADVGLVAYPSTYLDPTPFSLGPTWPDSLEDGYDIGNRAGEASSGLPLISPYISGGVSWQLYKLFAEVPPWQVPNDVLAADIIPADEWIGMVDGTGETATLEVDITVVRSLGSNLWEVTLEEPADSPSVSSIGVFSSWSLEDANGARSPLESTPQFISGTTWKFRVSESELSIGSGVMVLRACTAAGVGFSPSGVILGRLGISDAWDGGGWDEQEAAITRALARARTEAPIHVTILPIRSFGIAFEEGEGFSFDKLVLVGGVTFPVEADSDGFTDDLTFPPYPTDDDLGMGFSITVPG